MRPLRKGQFGLSKAATELTEVADADGAVAFEIEQRIVAGVAAGLAEG